MSACGRKQPVIILISRRFERLLLAKADIRHVGLDPRCPYLRYIISYALLGRVMTSSWKSLGRTLEISTIVILVLAVGYLLWVNFDSEDTDTTRDPSRQPVAITDTVEPPNQPSLHRTADTDTYRQPEETPRSTELTLPIEPHDPLFQDRKSAV